MEIKLCVEDPYPKLELSYLDLSHRQTLSLESAKICAEWCITENLKYINCFMFRLTHPSSALNYQITQILLNRNHNHKTY